MKDERPGGTMLVAVWDLPTRLFHWALVGLIAFSWWSAEYHEDDLHIWSGLAVLTLGACRRLHRALRELRAGAEGGVRLFARKLARDRPQSARSA